LQELLQAKPYKQEDVDAEVAKIKKSLPDYFKDYYEPIDKKMLGAMLEMYFKNVAKDQQPEIMDEINKKYKGNFQAYADEIFAKSIFACPDKVNTFLEKPKAKSINQDPTTKLIQAFLDLRPALEPKQKSASEKAGKGERLYIAGLREMSPDKTFYPDANSTMRLSYGQVLDYYPEDAVHYDFTTHLSGVMQKEDPANYEFVVPAKLKELYNKKDFGQYGENGDIVTCFITNNDITGGNSGSPVLDGNGELIGLAFDGNWEAMSGDIAFEPDLQRTICVDARYVLFIIDKYAGATNLIKELTIVKDRH
jgi:hypothetical protein